MSGKERKVKPMTDSQLLQWLRDSMVWDGHGYWLPDICIKEMELGDVECIEPTMAEFRSILNDLAKNKK